jgi:hypothetical protein
MRFYKYRNRARRAIFCLPHLVQGKANAKVFSESADTMDELLQKNRFSNNKTLTRAITDKVRKTTRPETTAFELLRASLGFIFSERYGWTDEKIDDMTLPEVLIALEHAMDYDSPSKKSVWNF